MSTLYRNGRIHTRAVPGATAMLVEGERVAWLGPDGAAESAGAATATVDLAGALVTPAFVDAHVHCFDTGLQLLGVDATAARSVAQLLDLVADAAHRRPGTPVLGHGWDETLLSDARPPTAAELDRAAGGVAVYLSRVDVHSAVVSSAVVSAGGLAGLPGWLGEGRVERDAHHAARAVARDLPVAGRAAAHEAALRAAAAAGIGTVHEMAGPDIAGPTDLAVLGGVAAAVGVDVLAYWGAAVGGPDGPSATEVLDGVRGTTTLPVVGLGGDLCVDGSIGSRTAALREAYADGTGTGHLQLSAEQIVGHVAACGGAGVQAGFHVIGDAALDAVLHALDEVAARDGAGVGRRARVRLEHVEAADDRQIARLAAHGVTVSMQPAFQATWGGADGMYSRRLGPDRARRLNRYAAMATAGIPLAFGSDSPVTPFHPWAAVAAATSHDDPAESVSARAAFTAHTRGAHRAVGAGPDAGTLDVGSIATFAVWQAGDLVVQVPDDRVSAWSTDPRSATPALPDLRPGAPLPTCLRTVVAGRTVHEA